MEEIVIFNPFNSELFSILGPSSDYPHPNKCNSYRLLRLAQMEEIVIFNNDNSELFYKYAPWSEQS